ncbi:glycerate kinase family protein [Enterococcus sp. DIV0876]|uniref:glycerate kinase family protein n=1 Tax=Enterococcus sp. DIV0876 TaxID=2774633 RepID=UPI003D2FB849
MKIVAAIDSFKGSATSEELNDAVLKGFPDYADKINLPIADGGEGTMAAIHASLGGEYIEVSTQDPLGKVITAHFLLTMFKGRNIAVIESATVIGMDLVEQTDDTTLNASSFGLGIMVLAALKRNVQKIYLTLGGTATSDGGLGFLQAIGATLQPNQPKRGNPLLWVDTVDLTTLDPRLSEIDMIGLADVTNPYTGENGFAHIFGPQKGASAETIQQLDQRAVDLMNQLPQARKKLLLKNGSGAAGGMGGAILLADGRLQAGFETIADIIGFKEKITQADFVITGEGKIDQQTAHGKVPFGVATIANDLGIPVIALCGSRQTDIGEMDRLAMAVLSIQQGPITLEQAMDHQRTLDNTYLTARAIAGIIFGRQK